MRKLNLTLALAAGLLGGFIPRTVTLPSVRAQEPTPPPVQLIRPPQVVPAPPPPPPSVVKKEIRAQSFTLVDRTDHALGTFTVDRTGRIVLRDPAGREIWSADR